MGSSVITGSGAFEEAVNTGGGGNVGFEVRTGAVAATISGI
jgi:hypothetical protein